MCRKRKRSLIFTSVQETEGETEENTTEAAVEAISVETPQAGTIAEGAANQAAATVVYEGHTYARFDIALNYPQAEKFCEQAGGHLATLTSWRENLAVQSILDDASYDEYWLGASDEEWEGSWKWTTGEAFDWTNWDDSQPDNYNGDEDFLTIYSYYGSWNDRSSGRGRHRFRSGDRSRVRGKPLPENMTFSPIWSLPLPTTVISGNSSKIPMEISILPAWFSMLPRMAG